MATIDITVSHEEAKFLLEKTYAEWRRLNKTRTYILDKWGDIATWPHKNRLEMIEGLRLKMTLDKFNNGGGVRHG